MKNEEQRAESREERRSFRPARRGTWWSGQVRCKLSRAKLCFEASFCGVVLQGSRMPVPGHLRLTRAARLGDRVQDISVFSVLAVAM
jgi:hypothetical protein